MSGLPPYGWSVRESDRETVVRGWDWILGAATLTHGMLTLPLCVWFLGSFWLGTTIWLLISLPIAAGLGWQVTVDAHGFTFATTWFCIPVSRKKRFERGSPVGVGDDPYAPDGADFSRYAWLGEHESVTFGTTNNCEPIKGALDRAIQRHHR